MGLSIIKSNSRGLADHGWLKSYHSFSFASYRNPDRMGFGLLRVINDDQVAPGKGFTTHPHKNMEIISIPLSGSLRHKDNQGNDTVIKNGEVQIMSAGAGLTHSEYNHSLQESVNFLQIWILPKEQDIKPRYDQKRFDSLDRKNKIQYIVNPIGSSLGGVEINQDAFFAMTDITANASVSYESQNKENGLYVFVLEGEVLIDNNNLQRRDAISILGRALIDIKASLDSQILLIEVPLA